ncbi:MAG: penicillin-binding protein activator [bacterium]|nr:penicillin-binding protein activator [bacterium]
MKRRSIFQFVITSFLVAVLTASCGLFGNSGTDVPNPKNTSIQNKTFKIAGILPLTGPAADSAEYIKKGMDLAAEEINAKEPGSIDLIYENSKNEVKLGVSAFQKLAITQKPNAIVISRSSITKAVAPLTKDSKTVLIATSVAIPKVTDSSEYVFRVYPEANGLAGVAAKYAIKQCKSATVIYVNDDFGLSSAEVFQKTFEKEGQKVVSKEPYNPTEKDFRTQLEKIKSLDPSCIWLVGYGPAYSTIIKQIRELNIPSEVIADQTLGLPITVQQTGSAAEGIVYVDAPIGKEFAETYQKRYGNLPTSYAGYSYDIVKMLDKVRKEKGVSNEDIRIGLSSIKDFSGAMGKISILPNRDASIEFVLMQIKNGKPTIYK